jgi:hypothetical protein
MVMDGPVMTITLKKFLISLLRQQLGEGGMSKATYVTELLMILTAPLGVSVDMGPGPGSPP